MNVNSVPENNDFSGEYQYQPPSVEQKPKKEKKPMKSWAKILVIVLSVAIVGVGVYLLLANFVLFPKFDAALLYNTLHSKLDWDMNYKAKLDQGRMDLSVSAPESQLRDYYRSLYPHYTENRINELVQNDLSTLGTSDLVNLTVSAMDNKANISVELLEKKLNLALDENNIAVSIDDFHGGQYYGVSGETMLDDFRNSIFAPDSGSNFALDQQTYEMIESLIENMQNMGEDSKLTKELDTVLNIFTESFENSSISECTTAYDGAKVLGKERDGRTKTYEITKADIENFLEILIDRLENLSNEEEEAFASLLDTMTNVSGEEITVRDLTKALKESLNSLKSVEDNNTKIKIQFVYVYTCLSAVTIEAKSSNEDYYGNMTVEKTVIALDFGEKPNQDKDIVFTMVNYEDGEEQDRTEVAYRVKSDKDKTTVTFAVNSEYRNSYGDIREYTDTLKIVLDRSKNKMTIKALSEYDYEEEEIFEVVIGYYDSKTNLRLTLDGFYEYGEEIPLPICVELNFYQKANNVTMPSYTNIIRMSEDEFITLGEDLTLYLQDWDEFKNLID